MAHMWMYGKMFFYETHDKAELRKIAYDMMSKSITHRFGLKFCANLPFYRLQKMDLSGWQAGNCLIYEITDDPISDECCDLYDGIWMGPHDLVGIENSRLIDLERFVSDMLSHRTVSCMEFCTEDVHGDNSAGTTMYTIKVNELCRVMTTAPRIHTEMPNVKVLILK